MGGGWQEEVVEIDVRYDAFMSYNHGADAELAAAVERGLQRLAKPWYKLRALSVFRDLSDTGLNPSLWGTVQRQLDQSRWLILMACPESADSEWVRKEAAHWCDTRGVETVLIVLTGGELAWDRERGGFSSATTALEPGIAARFVSEPLHLDLRWAKPLADPSLRLARFRADMARLASPIRDLPPDEIEGEDIRLHRKARRLARGAVAMLVALTVAASAAAVVAVVNKNRADRRAREATARQIGLLALDMPASNLDQALLFSVVAADLDADAGVERFRASRTLLGRNARLVQLLHTPSADGDVSLRGIAVSADGTQVAATGSTNQEQSRLFTWAFDRPTEPRSIAIPSDVGPAVAFDNTGRAVVGGTGQQIALTGGSGVDSVGGRIVALDAAGERALVAEGSVVRLHDLATGDAIGEWEADHLVGAMSGRRATLAHDGLLDLVDATNGTLLASAPVGGTVAAVAIDPATEGAVTISTEGRITLWERDGDGLVGTLSGSPDVVDLVDLVGPPAEVALGADHANVLVVGEGGSAIVELDSGNVVATAAGSGGLAVDPTRRFAAIGGTSLTVWDLLTGRRVAAVPEKTNAMAWSGCDDDPCRLVVAGETIDVWEPTTGRRIRLADQTNAQTVAITADGSRVVSAGWGTTVAIWDLDVPIDNSGRTELARAGPPSAADARTGAIARMVDAAHAEITLGDEVWPLETGPVTTMYLVSDPARLLTFDDGVMRLFDVAAGVAIDLDRSCSGELVAVSPLGRRVVAHDPSTGRTAVCATTDGVLIAGAMVGGAVSGATAIAVDDDGSIVLGGSGFVQYHEIDGSTFGRGTAVDARFGGESVEVRSVALRAGHVAAGIRSDAGRSESARVLVWDAAGRGTAVQFDTDHPDVPAVGLLGDDADILVTAARSNDDGTVVMQLWERDTRRRLGRGLDGLFGDVVMLGGDETAVVGTDAGGRTYRWSLERDPRREVCAIVGRSLTRDEWSSIAGGVLDRYEFTPVCEP
jgi:WD40 repeat protein